MARYTMLVCCFVVLGGTFVAAARAQQLPPPTVGAVTITGPTQAGGDPWRTQLQVLPLLFTTDAANGRFVAVSTGGDVSFSMFLATGGAGQVAVGFDKEGPHNVQVVVTSLAIGPPAPTVSSASAAVSIIYDRTPPTVTISQIKVNDLQGFVPFNPNETYYTNANAVVFKGTVSDQYTPRDQITVFCQGSAAAETVADSAGSFELSVDIGGLSDGPLQLDVLAKEKLSDGSFSEAGRPVRAKFGAD